MSGKQIIEENQKIKINMKRKPTNIFFEKLKIKIIFTK